MKPTILITGGAGYIGSHTAYCMVQQGYNVIILDTLVHGQQWLHPWACCIVADFADAQVLDTIFQEHNVQAVMHFAAYAQVGQSVKEPLMYYDNNVSKTVTLLQKMREHGVKKIIFSSSCAVYGIPQTLPLTEDHPCNPINPYGATKHMIERVLEDCSSAYDLQYVSLRYFNAAGGLPELGLSEQHEPETHLIPLLFQAATTNTPFTLFGVDHDTFDGSCIRDFLHVVDIAQAHSLALTHLNNGLPSDIFNLGTGTGFSVKQVIAAAEQICKTTIQVIYSAKRAGDPTVLVANASRAHDMLGWNPTCSSLEFILQSAYFPVVQPIYGSGEHLSAYRIG
ncbi:UDP-glucose 4-epimerase GalE [Candidatus Dependentiae bacterium]|nr:UDP-glucose 4-epimerase GalE [Candidatus Dependentiae bacterium]MCC7414469.1 UDP-glucose 4-epimerase GalE [Campylobacterota bacterium]